MVMMFIDESVCSRVLSDEVFGYCYISCLNVTCCCDCELRTDYFLYLWFLLCNIVMSLCIYKCMHFSDF